MMLKVLTVLAVLTTTTTADNYSCNLTAADAYPLFAKKTGKPVGVLTTTVGGPVEYKDATRSINRVLLRDTFLVELLTQLVRERIPERVVHAKGAGAFGYFEVTRDISNICKAKMFGPVGKRTRAAVRFSTQFGNLGGEDTERANRGMAIKFYTEEGNFDLMTLAIDVFNLKDPVLFANFHHSARRNPKTGTFDPHARWDFITQRPETILNAMFLFSDIGITDGYRYMPGFSVHPYAVYNDEGVTSYIKFHFTPDGGIRTLSSAEAKKIQAEDLDYATRDLHEAILNGDFPTWTVGIQYLTAEQAKNASFDVFDITMRWPVKDIPVIPIGKFVLNENPRNVFADVEQMAFGPANLVPGILGGADDVYQIRLLAYLDAHHYRLGKNFHKIEVNSAKSPTYTYYRDGVAPVGDNYDGMPNYYPNSFNGPIPYIDKNRPELIKLYTDPNPTNFGQAHDLYEEEMSEGERTRLVANIVESLNATLPFIQKKAVDLFQQIHPELGQRIAVGLYGDTV